jgi:hypothetical protein
LLAEWSDVRLANSSRLAARELCKRFTTQNRPLWFQGHWGFQYYMEEQGAKPVDYYHSVFSAGDLMVMPLFGTNREMPPATFSRTQGLAWISCRLLTPWSADAGAGFFSDFAGPLPCALVAAQSDGYDIYEVGTACNFHGQPVSAQ